MEVEVNNNEVIGLKHVIVKYLLHWRLFLAAFLCSFVPALLYLICYPRTYEVAARVRILEDREMGGATLGMGEAAGLMRTFGLGAMAAGAVNIEDEINVLTSNALLKKMVRHLGLHLEYTRPYSFYRLYKDVPFALHTDSLTLENLYEEILFKLRPHNGGFLVHTESEQYGKNKFHLAALPAVISLPHGDFTLAYAPGNKNPRPERMDILLRPPGWVAEDMEEDFVVEEISKTSTVVELSCTDYERERGIRMLNQLIAFYNEETSSFKGEESLRTLAYLDARIDTLSHSLRLAESEIAVYKNTHTLTDVEHDVQFYIEQMRDLQVKLIEMESQSHLIEMMDEFVKTPANQYNLVPVLLNQEGEGSPLMAYNGILVERARVIQNSNQDNPLAKNLTEQADQLRESVYLSISNAQKATRQGIDEIRQKEKALVAQMEGFPDKERDYRELMRRQEILQGIYLVLLQTREETALNYDLNRDKAQVLDAAFVRAKPVAPRKLFAAIGMLAFTLLVGVGYLFCKEQALILIDEYRRAKNRS